MFHLEKCAQFAKHNIARGSKFCGKYKPPPWSVRLFIYSQKDEWLSEKNTIIPYNIVLRFCIGEDTY